MANKKFQFDPVNAMDNDSAISKPLCPFKVKNVQDAKKWQRRTRKLLGDCLGFLDQKKVPLQPKVLEEVDRGDFIRKKVVLQTMSHSHLPVYILMPKNRTKSLPCVLALHGHGYGVKEIVGLFKNGDERYEPEGCHKDFACELARRGFLVAAPELAAFGEHSPYYDGGSLKDQWPGCYRVAMNAIMYGGSVHGLRVWENMRLLDYLETLKEADTSRIGAYGISGGGTSTFFTTAMEKRIKACVVSGYFCQLEGSILASDHCVCNFVPGMMKLGQLSDLAGLIAPRPCLVEHGKQDKSFPIKSVKKTVTQARKAWKAFDVEQLLQTDFFTGTHRINGAKSYDFLARYLNSALCNK